MDFKKLDELLKTQHEEIQDLLQTLEAYKQKMEIIMQELEKYFPENVKLYNDMLNYDQEADAQRHLGGSPEKWEGEKPDFPAL